MNSLPALDLAPLAGMTKAEINDAYIYANAEAARWEKALCEVDAFYRAECRAEIRSQYNARVRAWAFRAADCVKAYRLAA